MEESKLIAVLEREGALTGAELLEASRAEVLDLWASARCSARIIQERIGKRFLRLDRAVAGYARLSPSIRREFLTYTLLATHGGAQKLKERASALWAETREISAAKARMTTEVARAVAPLDGSSGLAGAAAFILAGDVVYEMAHSVPRPERSTGEMVRGSDLDLVVVTRDDLPEEGRDRLDKALLQRKHVLLRNPGHREELDYIIKPLATVGEQIRFDTFEAMVACKILHEGVLVWGSEELFALIKRLLLEKGVVARLQALEAAATEQREASETALLAYAHRLNEAPADMRYLFYTKEESEEIY